MEQPRELASRHRPKYGAVLFSHGWPLSAGAWDGQMLFLGQQGYRVIGHDRRASSVCGAGDVMVRLVLLYLSREVSWETPRGDHGNLASQLGQARPSD
jgi:pimeloyl-ACP methyl ester carboxylesterase